MSLEVREVSETDEPPEVDTSVAEAIIEGVPWQEMQKERRASLKSIYDFVNQFHPMIAHRRLADGSQSGELVQDDIPACVVQAQNRAFVTAWDVAGDLIAEMGRQLCGDNDA